MAIAGSPNEWQDVIGPFVPQILTLIITSWQAMPPPSAGEKEERITPELFRSLLQNKDARLLPFRIHMQQVELGPEATGDDGRMDIVFNPPIPSEEIYFCMECKRLNALINGRIRADASEYVKLGMLRFVTGRYARAVRHGGMIGYVLDGNISRAKINVEANIRKQRAMLCMTAPAGFLASTLLQGDERIRETHHHRPHEVETFRIHHVFLAAK